MAERKKSTTKPKPVRKRTSKPKLLCTAQLSDGNPCPKTVESGKERCLWHNPLDKTWEEVYVRLETTPPEQKEKIVLGFIKSHPEHKLELHEWYGKTADLSGADLSYIDLQNASLSSVNLEGAFLRSTNLRGAHLGSANLKNAVLEDADLRDTNLIYTKLQGSYLNRANLESADLTQAEMENAHMVDANCKYAKFLNATLQSADLQGADLQEANLMQAKLQETYLNRAILTRAHLEKADLRGANLNGADGSHAFWFEANLQTAQLTFTNLQGAQLDGANLQGSNLMHANLQGASLVDTKLQGVDLSAASDISNIYLSGAWLDRTRIYKKQFRDKIGEELEKNYHDARHGYIALKQNFDDLGDYGGSSWAYRKERQMEKLEALQQKKYFKFFSDSLVEWVCDYGESVWRVIGWMAILLLIVEPLLLSLLGGFYWNNRLAHDYFALSSPWSKFWFSYLHHILYSLSGVGTSGFSGFQAANLKVDFASSLFSIVDVFLVGLLGFVAANRIRRS